MTTTTRIVETPEGPAVLLPEGFRFRDSTVAIERDGDTVIVEPLRSSWPEDFFEKIHIDDPNFQRPDQGKLPPAPSLE
jgi:virulence-associated protein VagC